MGRAPKEPSDVTSGNKPIRTQFVIDLLSGSSAGSVNAVYLGKALANDQPMDELKNLWTTEGDIGILINDKHSVRGTGLNPQVPHDRCSTRWTGWIPSRRGSSSSAKR